MKRFHTLGSISAATILLLLALFSGRNYVEGRQMTAAASMDLASSKAVRDLQISKEMKEETLRGEKDSFRRIPRSGSSPIQNKNGPLTDVKGTRKQHITAREP